LSFRSAASGAIGTPAKSRNAKSSDSPSGTWGARDGCSELPGTAEASWQLPQRSLAHQMPAFSGTRGQGEGGGARGGKGGARREGSVTKYKELCRTSSGTWVHALAAVNCRYCRSSLAASSTKLGTSNACISGNQGSGEGGGGGARGQGGGVSHQIQTALSYSSGLSRITAMAAVGTAVLHRSSSQLPQWSLAHRMPAFSGKGGQGRGGGKGGGQSPNTKSSVVLPRVFG